MVNDSLVSTIDCLALLAKLLPGQYDRLPCAVQLNESLVSKIHYFAL